MKNIKKVTAELKSTLTSISKSKSRKKILESAGYASTLALSIHKSVSAYSKPGKTVRSNMSFILKNLEGIETGVSGDILARSELRSIVENCVTNKLNLHAELQELSPPDDVDQDADAELVPTDDSGNPWSQLAGLKKQMTPKNDQPDDAKDKRFTQEEKKKKAKLYEKRGKLPTSIPRISALVRLPVLPIFSSWEVSTLDNAKRMGIPTMEYMLTTVFLDQPILLVDSKKASVRLGWEANSEDMLEVANNLLRALANKRGKNSGNFHLVTDTPIANPKNPKILAFWAMEDRKLRALLKMFGGRGADVREWGFPF